MRKVFHRFASWSAALVGSPSAFLIAVTFCAAWGISGSHFHYSDTWQLVANTVTNLSTFLLAFLIQYSQNRNTQATQLKLDELVRSIDGARNGMIRLEELPDAELDRLEQEMRRLRGRVGRPRDVT